MNKNSMKVVIITAFLLLLLFVFIYFLFIQNNKTFELFVRSYGLLGLFLGAIIANASILLPLPIDIFVFILANQPFVGTGLINPLLIGLIVGFGSAIGEMSGYILGLLGAAGIETVKEKEFLKLDAVKKELKQLGAIFIVFGAFTPFPFDLIGIAAGLTKFNPKLFFVACFTGKLFRYLLIAFAGYYSINFVRAFFGF